MEELVHRLSEWNRILLYLQYQKYTMKGGHSSQKDGFQIDILVQQRSPTGYNCPPSQLRKAPHKLSQFLAAALADWPDQMGGQLQQGLWVDYISWSAYEEPSEA